MTPPPAHIEHRDLPLDALRGIALLAVCLFHSNLLLGGWLGVDLFFVISGLWITRKLTSSEQRLTVFAVRRATRLLPALTVLLVAWLLTTTWTTNPLTAAWTVTDTGEPLPAAAVPVVAGAGITNWWMFTGQPWPDALGHLWSLAVEWQFYLAAPLLLWMLLRTRSARARIAALVSVAVGCAMLNTILILPEFGIAAAYLSTGGRVPALLAGVTVALILATRRPQQFPDPVSAGPRPWWVAPAVGAWVCLVIAAPQNTLGVAVAIPVAALLSGVLVWTAATHTTFAGSVTKSTAGVFAWLGKRSYAAYLWNLPIVVAADALLVEMNPISRAGIALTLTVIIAAISWHLMERPIARWVQRRTTPTPHSA